MPSHTNGLYACKNVHEENSVAEWLEKLLQRCRKLPLTKEEYGGVC